MGWLHSRKTVLGNVRPKYIRPILAGFIYFAANRDNAVNHILITGIVLNSILTAFDFVNVPNSDIAIF